MELRCLRRKLADALSLESQQLGKRELKYIFFKDPEEKAYILTVYWEVERALPLD